MGFVYLIFLNERNITNIDDTLKMYCCALY